MLMRKLINSLNDHATKLARKSFFVRANSLSSIKFTGYETYGDESLPPLYLETGWNMYGVHGHNSITFSEAFGSYASRVFSVWKYDSGDYVKLNTTNVLNPGVGYFVYILP